VDVAKAKFNMIEQQIRAWDVLEPRLLEALRNTPREKFVADCYLNLAFADTFIPLAAQQVMLPPKVVGRLLLGLDLQPNDTVLEIGTGSGYCTSLMAKLSKSVLSVDISTELLKQARGTINSLHITNIELQEGDGFSLTQSIGTFDAILLTGSTKLMPNTLLNLLQEEARMVAVVGQSPMMTAMKITKHGSKISEEKLFETDIPPLINGPCPEEFIF